MFILLPIVHWGFEPVPMPGEPPVLPTVPEVREELFNLDRVVHISPAVREHHQAGPGRSVLAVDDGDSEGPSDYETTLTMAELTQLLGPASRK